MANNYSQWSSVLEISSDEEYAWLQEVLNLDPFDALDKDPNTDMDRYIAEVRSKLGFTFNYEDFELPFPDFSHKLSKNELWVYAEEYGNLDNLGRIVQAFLRKFRPNGSFYVTWADSCDKPRIDEFGGGAMFVTAEKIETFTVYDWIAQKLKQNKI